MMGEKWLVIDSNYILHKNVFTLLKMNSLYGDFHKMLTMNLTKFTKQFSYDKIILVSDSKRKSWRKRILDKYKEHRKRDTEIDWEWIFTNYAIWKQDMQEEQGVTILEADGIEGDDWIAALSSASWKMGHSTVVVSSDRDLCQLLKWNDNQINIQIEDINGKEKVLFPLGYEIYMNSLQNDDNSDPFDLNSKFEWDEMIKRWNQQWLHEEYDPKALLVEKFIKGDKGDNIDSVYQKIIKNGKIQNIGDGGARKIYQRYLDLNDENYDIKSADFLKKLAECVCDINKLDFETSGEGIITKLHQNRTLIELHHRHWPKDVKEKIVEQLENVLL